MYNPRLNFYVDGSGPHLLMIHGFGISFNIWQFLLPFLRSHFTLIMIELPGVGCSPVPEQSYLDEAVSQLERVRSLIGIERWNIFGYSSGTRIVERYVQLHTKHVERVVFLCPAQTSRLKAYGLYVAVLFDQYVPQFGNWILSGPRLKFLIELLGFNLKKNSLSYDWFAEISSQQLRILKETLRSLSGGCKEPFCVPDDVPRLFVWGDKDLIIDAPIVPSRQDRIIPATHSAPQTAPQKVSDIVIPFLHATEGNL